MVKIHNKPFATTTKMSATEVINVDELTKIVLEAKNKSKPKNKGVPFDKYMQKQSEILHIATRNKNVSLKKVYIR